MSATTQERMQVSYFRTAIDGFTVSKVANGTSIIKGLPVFRTGTFRDSMGEQQTWEREHLERMVFHFEMLRDRNVLPNIPVRDQHRSLFGGGGTVVGYVQELRVEGQDAAGNDLLVADLEITEPDAFSKIERGTWRSRSAEIGYYESNDEAMYWPVFMGVAWVDLPAVEGLFGKEQSEEGRKFTPITDEEGAVSHANKQHSQQGGTPPAEGGQEGAQSTGQEDASGASTADQTGDPEQGGEGGPGAGDGSEGNEGGGGEGGQSAPATPAATPPVTEHSAPQAGSFQFTINGAPTTDFAAVQAHIENLETVISEGREQARRDFVSALAADNKIAATQVEALTNHALSLDEKQYESFAASYADVPAMGLFSHHGQTETRDSEESQVDTLRERVKMHRQGGMSDEKVKQTESYKKLMELTDNKG